MRGDIDPGFRPAEDRDNGRRSPGPALLHQVTGGVWLAGRLMASYSMQKIPRQTSVCRGIRLSSFC